MKEGNSRARRPGGSKKQEPGKWEMRVRARRGRHGRPRGSGGGAGAWGHLYFCRLDCPLSTECLYVDCRSQTQGTGGPARASRVSLQDVCTYDPTYIHTMYRDIIHASRRYDYVLKFVSLVPPARTVRRSSRVSAVHRRSSIRLPLIRCPPKPRMWVLAAPAHWMFEPVCWLVFAHQRNGIITPCLFAFPRHRRLCRLPSPYVTA